MRLEYKQIPRRPPTKGLGSTVSSPTPRVGREWTEPWPSNGFLYFKCSRWLPLLHYRIVYARSSALRLWATNVVATLQQFFSERELTFTFAICYRPSVCLSSVCRLSSVTFVRPTQAIVNFGNFSTAFGTLAILEVHIKFYGDRPRGTPPSGELNITGVTKYSDFGPIEGYISETMQDRR